MRGKKNSKMKDHTSSRENKKSSRHENRGGAHGRRPQGGQTQGAPHSGTTSS
jgi:hypothetical protein